MTYKILRTNSQANEIEILERRVAALEEPLLTALPCSAAHLTDDEVLNLAHQSEDPLLRRLVEIVDPDPSEEESPPPLDELWELHAAVDRALDKLSTIIARGAGGSVHAVRQDLREAFDDLREAFDGVSTDD